MVSERVPGSRAGGEGLAAGPATPPLPERRYDVIYADPPWPYYGDPNKDQAAGKHYRLMSLEAISALPVGRIAARPAALFLWATGPKLPEAVEVMAAWGFHFRGIAYVWVKTTKDKRIIAGQGVRPTFTKPTTELVLVGSSCARGRPFPLRTEAQAQVILAPRGRHSQKPGIVRERIVELLGDRARIELFARECQTGDPRSRRRLRLTKGAACVLDNREGPTSLAHGLSATLNVVRYHGFVGRRRSNAGAHS